MTRYVIYILYTVLLSTRVILPQINSIAMLVMVCINGFIYLCLKQYSDLALFSSFLMPGEIFPTINFMLGLTMRSKVKTKFTIRVDQFPLFALIFAYSLISAVLHDTIPNFVFSIVYLGIIFFAIRMSVAIIEPNAIVKYMKLFVVIEFLITLMIILKYRIIRPGDEFSGSMSSAHWLGNWLIVALILFCFHDSSTNKIKFSMKAVKKNLVYILLLLAMIYLADAKSLLIAFGIGAIGYIVFERGNARKYGFMFFLIAFCACLFVLFAILYFEPVKNYILKTSKLLGIYLYGDGWNGKFDYIRGTLLEELLGARFLFGFGLGQYGSRIANLFAYDAMWRANNCMNNLVASLFKPHWIPQYAQYVRFYNEDFVSQIGWRSAVMSYPFNSVTAMIAETGIIGVIFFSKVFNSYVKDSECKILAYYFAVACFFDLYFDNFPCVAIIIFVILNTQVKRGRQKHE